MLNHEPIFVNGLSRGGTTILLNLLASHPDVCLIGETHHVFKGTTITDSVWDVLRKCLYHDAPIIMGQGQDFFSPRLIKPRKPLSRWAKHRIDAILYREKLRSAHPRLNRFKGPHTEYNRDEIVSARLLCKNIDGMIYANDAWTEMYPGAVFYGLVRNGLAVCEGHVRRGRSAAEIGRRYQLLVDKMLADADRLPRYRIVRFEDVLTSPWDSLQAACAHAGLDIGRLTQIRMQTRRVMDAEGNHRLCGDSEWDVIWLRPQDLARYFHHDVDANQIRRLSKADRDAFVSEAGKAMDRLGYSTLADSPPAAPANDLAVLPFVRPSANDVPRTARAA
jgi:hypothetical protein